MDGGNFDMREWLQRGHHARTMRSKLATASSCGYGIWNVCMVYALTEDRSNACVASERFLTNVFLKLHLYGAR